MRRILAFAILFLGIIILVGAAPSRSQGLSLHMLPKEVAEISGNKWGFIVTLPGQKRIDKTIQSAEELYEYFKSLPKEIQENGIWIVTTHPDSYSGEEKQVLEDVKDMCIRKNIPLFICRGSELPNGWRRVEEEPNKQSTE